MRDSEFLYSLRERLITVYKEPLNSDVIRRLQEVALRLKEAECWMEVLKRRISIEDRDKP